MFWNQQRVFITGATGIVGSWLARELLNQGAHVLALIRDADPQTELFRSGDVQRVATIAGKLEDYGTLERAINEHEIETVFHLGAQTIVGAGYRSPLPTFESNIRGTYNLLEACRIHSNLIKRVVIASSDKAYGAREDLPYTEDMPLEGAQPYEVSKSCADLLAQSYHRTYQLPVAVARCGNIYGGGDLNWSRIVPGTIRSFLRGESPIIRSDGKFLRDYIYVKDVVDAYLKLAEFMEDSQVAGQAFNFSDESPLSVLEIVGAIQKLLDCGHLEPTILNQAVGEIKNQYLSAARARSVLAWRPGYNLTQGLGETIDWYRTYLKISA